jgi:hypothetical protein
METPPTITDPNIAAEVRAVEEGHRANLDRSGASPRIRVVSDTKPGKHYVVAATATTSGAGIVFECTPEGDHAYEDDHLHVTSPEPGVVPCKHAAVAARRLERERFAVLAYPYNGDRRSGSRWVATVTAERLVEAARSTDDPFAGFPR